MDIKLEINDKSIVINGVDCGSELSIEKIKQALGEPRPCKTEPDKNYREYMEKRRGKDYFDNSVSLVWDDCGIYSHSEDGKTLQSFGIVFDNTKKTAIHTPKSNFSGTIAINGEDWLAAVKKGRNMFGSYCKLALSEYVIFAEYSANKMALSERAEKDFTLIEITHSY